MSDADVFIVSQIHTSFKIKLIYLTLILKNNFGSLIEDLNVDVDYFYVETLYIIIVLMY